MRQLDIAQFIVNTMSPVNNDLQDQLKGYIQSNSSDVNDLIYSNPQFKSQADAISALITQLRIDVCYQIFVEKFCEGDF